MGLGLVARKRTEKIESKLQDGKEDGLSTEWDENGQKQSEEKF